MRLSRLVAASRQQERRAFNKFNVVELMSQLMNVLKKNNLDDAVSALKRVAPAINDAWMKRER